jgi:hypothetical protein
MEAVERAFQDHYCKYIRTLGLVPLIEDALLDPRMFSGDLKFYLFYPRLFSDAFDVRDGKNLKMLCISGFLYYQSLLSLDRAFDSQSKAIKMRDMLFASTCQEEALKILGHLFPPSSSFWHKWNRRKLSYFEALDMEKLGRINSDQGYSALADSKSAFGKVAIDALYMMGRESHEAAYNSLLVSHRYFSIANQIIDDIQDIAEDIHQGQFNWVIHQLGKQVKKEPAEIAGMEPKAIKRMIYDDGLALSLYRKASLYYGKAIKASHDTKATLWLAILNGLKKKNDYRIETLVAFDKVNAVRRRLRKKISKPVQVPEIPKSSQVVFGIDVKGAIDYLIDEYNHGYTDLKHVMYLGKLDNFASQRRIHVGDIFQRALVADVYLELAQHLNIDFDEVTCREFLFLMRSRTHDGIGAWSYFPTVSEIAPDIDDLGQVIQFLVNRGRKSDLALLREMAEFAIRNCALGNGGLKTWILPIHEQNKKEQRQQYFNQKYWGEGPDVEVVANFLYSLTLLDKSFYNVTIREGIAYILSEMNEGGYWESKWYYGKYYGTYVCVRVLSAYEGVYVSQLNKAVGFILSSQSADGSWSSSDKDGDPLATALALMSLCLLDAEPYQVNIQKGVTYLQTHQLEDGSWRSVNFIRPRINDPYRSKTITTSFVLKAICSVRRTLIPNPDMHLAMEHS